jgi:Ca2+-binding RTX toxin-like protein
LGMLLKGGSGKNTISGTAGPDVIFGGKNDSLVGGAENDVIHASDGKDTVAGGDGNDTVSFGTNLNFQDTVDGGAAGTDVLAYTPASATATNDLNNVTNFELIDIGNASTSIITTDALVASGTLKIDADDIASTKTLTFDGTAEDDSVYSILGGDGTDSIVVGAGNHTIQGGTGADTITLGAGNETVEYKTAHVGATTAAADIITGFGTGTNVVDFTDLTNTDLRGNGSGFEVVAAGANAVAANTGIVEATGDVGDFAVSTALGAANTNTGWATGDIVYYLFTDGTDTALFRLSETTGNTTLDTGSLVATFKGVDETTFSAANFADFS